MVSAIVYAEIPKMQRKHITIRPKESVGNENLDQMLPAHSPSTRYVPTTWVITEKHVIKCVRSGTKKGSDPGACCRSQFWWCFWIGNCEEGSSNIYVTDLELASTQSAASPGGGVIAHFKLPGHPNRQ